MLFLQPLSSHPSEHRKQNTAYTVHTVHEQYGTQRLLTPALKFLPFADTCSCRRFKFILGIKLTYNSNNERHLTLTILLDNSSMLELTRTVSADIGFCFMRCIKENQYFLLVPLMVFHFLTQYFSISILTVYIIYLYYTASAKMLLIITVFLKAPGTLKLNSYWFKRISKAANSHLKGFQKRRCKQY